MGYSIFSNSGKQNYGIKHFVLDTIDEINKIPKNCAPGSTIFIIDNSSHYMLNTAKEWQQVILSKGTGGGNAGSGDIDEIIIYDGGSPI